MLEVRSFIKIQYNFLEFSNIIISKTTNSGPKLMSLISRINVRIK